MSDLTRYHELLFGVLTNLYVVGWLLLLLGWFLKPASAARQRLLWLGGRAIPLVLLSAFVIGWLLTRGLPGDIFSFDGVLLTNTVPEKVLSAWFEVLGLALLVCRWIVDDALKSATPTWIVILSLLGAFVAAALGLLAYLVLARSWAMIPRRSFNSR